MPGDEYHMIPEADLKRIAKEMEAAIRAGRFRVMKFKSDAPTKWCPGAVRDPLFDNLFSDGPEVWRFIANQLSAGWVIRPAPQHNMDPPEVAFEMSVVTHPHLPGMPPVYVKMFFRGGWVYGRSFHPSDRKDPDLERKW